MNLLVVCQYYHPEPFRIADICEALAAEGHKVTVVTGTPNYPEGEIYPGYEKGARRDEVINGVIVHRCPIIPRKSGAIYRFLNYYSFVASSWWHLLRAKEDYDVVFVNQLSPVMMAEAALAWAKRRNKKCVMYCLDLWPESLLVGGVRKDSAIYRVFLKISKRIYRAVDKLMVSSHGFIPYFEDVMGMDAQKISYLPQYAEDMFGQLPPVAGDKETVDFMFAGNVGNLQAAETIVKAARLLQDDPRIHIHIVGGGISLDSCKALTEGLTNITFYGRQDIQTMPQYYAMADAMLITLVKDPLLSANLPGKVQSYMAAGKAVLGAIDGETARIVRKAHCGMCSPAEDPEAFARLLRHAASDPKKLRAYGENARKYYNDNFRKEHFVSVLTQILQENCD